MPPSRRPERIESIELIPIGRLPEGVDQELAARLSRRIEAPCRVTGTPAGVDLPWLPQRQEQANADLLLTAIEALPTPDGAVRVGVTEVDLALPIFTFVFGRARHDGAVAVVSLARLRPEFYGLPPDPELTLGRAVNEMLHELGHVGGLRHCDEPRCLLRFAASVEAVDLRGSAFCAACAARLPPGLRVPGA
jgi:archaemetzincin